MFFLFRGCDFVVSNIVVAIELIMLADASRRQKKQIATTNLWNKKI